MSRISGLISDLYIANCYVIDFKMVYISEFSNWKHISHLDYFPPGTISLQHVHKYYYHSYLSKTQIFKLF